MLYKPKNLIPSDKLGPIIYPNKNGNYEFSFQGIGDEKIESYDFLFTATNLKMSKYEFKQTNKINNINLSTSDTKPGDLYIVQRYDKTAGLSSHSNSYRLENNLGAEGVTLLITQTAHAKSGNYGRASLYFSPDSDSPYSSKVGREIVSSSWINDGTGATDDIFWVYFIPKYTIPIAKDNSIMIPTDKYFTNLEKDYKPSGSIDITYYEPNLNSEKKKKTVSFSLQGKDCRWNPTGSLLFELEDYFPNTDSSFAKSSVVQFQFAHAGNSEDLCYLSGITFYNILVAAGNIAGEYDRIEEVKENYESSMQIDLQLLFQSILLNRKNSFQVNPGNSLNNYLTDSNNQPLIQKIEISKSDLDLYLSLSPNSGFESTEFTKFFWQCGYNNKILSDKVAFQIQEKIPEINYNIDKVIVSPTLSIQGKFNSVSSTLANYQWKLYKGTYDENTDQVKGNLIYQTPKIYSQDFQFEYDNLIPENYVIEAIVEDNYGQIWSEKEPFRANYEQNDLYLNLQSELDKENTGVKLKWDKLDYGVAVDQGTNSNLTLTEDLFAWMTEDQKLNYKKNLIKDGVLDLTYNEFGVPVLTNIVTYLFNSKSYLNINNTKMCYFSFLGQIYLDITKKEILIPLRTLNDFFGGGNAYCYSELRIQKDINGKYRPYIQTIFGNYKSMEFENFENPYTETGYYDIYCQYNFKNGTYKIATKKKDQSKWITAEIQTNLIPTTSIVFSTDLENISAIDYVLVTSKETCYEDNTPYLGKDISYEFENSEDTIYLNFNSIDNIWNVKDPAATTNFTGYNMKRYNPLTQKVLDMGQYYFTLKNTKEERRFVDYSLPHNEEVKYLIYPQGNETVTDEEGNKTSQELIFSPIYSDSIKGDWDKWCLFTTRGPAPKNLDGTADNGYNENVLLIDKVFFFEMNVETGSIKNNTDFSIVKNFTPYPHIQRSPSNYWSGQLKGLLGRLAIDDCTFKQTPTMLQEIKELTQNTSRKFLKDRDGNFWEVELSSDITIDNNDKLDVQLKTKSFNWVEVGDASDIALVSIGPGHEDWLLTELGQEQIDISEYTWDDNAIWDDSDFWTESE